MGILNVHKASYMHIVIIFPYNNYIVKDTFITYSVSIYKTGLLGKRDTHLPFRAMVGSGVIFLKKDDTAIKAF